MGDLRPAGGHPHGEEIANCDEHFVSWDVRAAFEGRRVVRKPKVRYEDPGNASSRLDAGRHARVPAFGK